ncbi:hypothetical protein AAFF_G00252520 [Aldrovandia affinis]|uniref:Uncharacterized protein n=1 Tax=Aldrovandia affinis TaxID=143900 RepID=A0AAD7STL9_9TELE|nr:hypothetical protein AAFF_G00252520 [Aldrovandia affinis]
MGPDRPSKAEPEEGRVPSALYFGCVVDIDWTGRAAQRGSLGDERSRAAPDLSAECKRCRSSGSRHGFHYLIPPPSPPLGPKGSGGLCCHVLVDQGSASDAQCSQGIRATAVLQHNDSSCGSLIIQVRRTL